MRKIPYILLSLFFVLFFTACSNKQSENTNTLTDSSYKVYYNQVGYMEMDEGYTIDVIASASPKVSCSRMDEYDYKYFENNVLIVINKDTSSGSFSYKVNNITREDTSLAIDIEALKPEVYTDDMSGWEIVIEISKENYNNHLIDINWIND